MNYSDFIIIYFACGAPFGVFYFLNTKPKNKLVWLKMILITIVWIPFSVKLLHSEVTKRLQLKDRVLDRDLIALRKSNLIRLQKDFEKLLPNDSQIISLFELREVIERYIGLSLIEIGSMNNPSPSEIELYQIEDNPNAEISALCLNRRNRKQLLKHQTFARDDFFKTIKMLLQSNVESPRIIEITKQFVKELDDPAAHHYLNDLINNRSQTLTVSAVRNLEKELWKPQEQKLSTPNSLSVNLPTLMTTTEFRKKD